MFFLCSIRPKTDYFTIRKLALCYAKGNDYVAACTCLENAMGIINKESHARDYLWLVQWSIQNGDNPTKSKKKVNIQ